MKINKQNTPCDVQKSEDNSKYEMCIICGAVTSVDKTTPIDKRPDYLPGAGQLCRKCAGENSDDEQKAMRSGFVYTLPVYQRKYGPVR